MMVDTQSHLQVSVGRCMFYPLAAFHRLYIDGFFSPCLDMGVRISDSSSVFIIVLSELSVKIDHPRWDRKLIHVHPNGGDGRMMPLAGEGLQKRRRSMSFRLPYHRWDPCQRLEGSESASILVEKRFVIADD